MYPVDFLFRPVVEQSFQVGQDMLVEFGSGLYAFWHVGVFCIVAHFLVFLPVGS